MTAFVKNNVEGTFVFNDPFSGISAQKCALRGPEMQNVIAGELNQESAFVIEELP